MKKILAIMIAAALLLSACAVKEEAPGPLILDGTEYSSEVSRLYGLYGKTAADVFAEFGEDYSDSEEVMPGEKRYVYKLQDGAQKISFYVSSAGTGDPGPESAAVGKITVTGGEFEITNGISFGDGMEKVREFAGDARGTEGTSVKITKAVGDGIIFTYAFDFGKELYHFAIAPERVP